MGLKKSKKVRIYPLALQCRSISLRDLTLSLRTWGDNVIEILERRALSCPTRLVFQHYDNNEKLQSNVLGGESLSTFFNQNQGGGIKEWVIFGHCSNNFFLPGI